MGSVTEDREVQALIPSAAAQPADGLERQEQEHAELLMLYRVSIDEVARVKQQQWRTFYAVIVAQAALATSLHFNPIKSLLVFHPIKWALGSLILVGILGLLADQASLHRLRRLIRDDYWPRLQVGSRDLLNKKNANDRTRWVYPAVMILSLVLAFYICWLIVDGQLG